MGPLLFEPYAKVYHLHEFRLLDATEQQVVSIGIRTDDDPEDRPVLPGWQVPLSKFFDQRNWHAPPASYAYDFGDDWQHALIHEGCESPDDGRKYPRCIAGERRRPPEDCVGSRSLRTLEHHMKAKLIVNPVSGTDAAPDLLTAINRQLRERIGPLDIVITTAEGDATQAAQDAVRDGYDHLFVGGGDGTLNEVLNGVARLEHGLAQITFGVIPLGTGNDFATALGLPEDISDAIEALLEGDAAAVDVGRMNDQYFVNVSAGGFIAEVSDAVNPQLKTIAGKLAYLIGGAQVVLTYEPVRAQLVRVESPTTLPASAVTSQALLPSSIDLHAFAICNSRLVGGGRLIAPYATIDDGRFDVCLIEAMPTVDFLALLKRVSDGEHVDDKRVTYFQAASLELAFERVIKVNTDGQVLETSRCCYELFPRAARFLRGRSSEIFR